MKTKAKLAAAIASVAVILLAGCGTANTAPEVSASEPTSTPNALPETQPTPNPLLPEGAETQLRFDDGTTVSVEQTNGLLSLVVTSDDADVSFQEVLPGTRAVCLTKYDTPVMGFEKVFALDMMDEYYTSRTVYHRFYAISDEDSLRTLVLGETFGCDTAEMFAADLDEDGCTELLTNAAYSADGRSIAKIYSKTADGISEAFIPNSYIEERDGELVLAMWDGTASVASPIQDASAYIEWSPFLAQGSYGMTCELTAPQGNFIADETGAPLIYGEDS